MLRDVIHMLIYTDLCNAFSLDIGCCYGDQNIHIWF